jgi:hypothetical protein
VLVGLLGSILTYKPQFVLGFLICWLIWGRIRPLLSFGILTLLWQIPVIQSHGLSPYLDYLKFTRILLYLPYAKDSFPISIMATPYALVTTLLPVSFAKVIQFLLILFGIAWRSRGLPISQRKFTLAVALLFPLIISPHALIYDLLILVPVLILLANYKEFTQPLKLIVVIFYLGVLFLPLIGYASRLALTGLIPIAMFIYMLRFYFRSNIAAVES